MFFVPKNNFDYLTTSKNTIFLLRNFKRYLSILILIIIIINYIFKTSLYWLSLVLSRFLPYIYLYFMLTLNKAFLIFLIFYVPFKYFYNISTNNFLNKTNHFSYYLLLNSTKYIDIHFFNQLEANYSEAYIFLLSPHAIYNQAFIYLFGNLKQRLKKPIIPLVHSLFNLIPFFSEYFSCFNFKTCSLDNINYFLDQQHSIVLTPGGIQEMFLTTPNCESIYIQQRQTIFDLSIKKQIKIVPILAIGESDWYTPPKIFQDIPFKYLKLFSYLFSWGKTWKPWLPKKNRLDILFGKPIEFPDDSKEGLSKLELLKKAYITQLSELHQQWNQRYQQNRRLIIK